MTDETSTRLEVWMDGHCPLCRGSQAWCERRDPNERLRFRDFRRAADHELPVAREDHETAMWVRDAGGELYEGFEGWLRIMAEIPRWRWLARLASLPPLDLIGPPIYQWIAARRPVSTAADIDQGRHSSTGTG